MTLWALVVGCGAPVPSPPPGALDVAGPLAFTVDGVEVPQAAVDVLVRRVGREQARWLDESDRTAEFVEHVALTQALYQRALRAGIHADPDVRLLLAMGQREILAKEYLRWEAARAVTPQVVTERYEQMPEFRIEQIRIRHLRVAEGADVDALKARLAAGAPFAALARETSADPQTAERGGDLGWLDRAVVEDTFGPEVAGAPAGALLGPIAAAGAVHLVWVEARRDAIPLDEVVAGLTEELRVQEQDRIAAEVRRELRIARPSSTSRGE